VSGKEALSKAAVAFKESGNTEDELFTQELKIIDNYRKSSPWAGIFLGFALGLSLVSLSVRSTRIGYRPHQGKCVSCGRCFKYCPVEVKNRMHEV